MTSAQQWSFPVAVGHAAGLDLAVGFGSVRLVAGAEPEVRVTVAAAASGRRQDLELAASTRVDLVGGLVTVRAQPRGRVSSLFRPGAVEITVTAPAGSSINADLGYAHLVAEGQWGQMRLHSSYGDVRVDRAERLEVRSEGGTVVAAVAGSASIRTVHGSIRITDLLGTAELRNSHGDTAIVRSLGELTVRSTYGAVAVDSAVTGTVDVATSYGVIHVGIPTGTAVRLDVHTDGGNLTNSLTPTETPAVPGSRLEITARSGWGDIIIGRSTRHQGDTP